ncbi:MAG: pyrroline-5-carboxylate reductase [Armatimonadetes bacterium]|nr:pyrroline-5-carboxylate reductase [Armatimonadota bacterium]
MDDRHVLGVIGTGMMGEAVIRGVMAAKLYEPSEIWGSNRGTEKLERLSWGLSFNAASSNEELVEKSDVLVLATKPQDVHTVLDEIQMKVRPDQILISVAAGITTTQLRKHLPIETGVVRTMPNTPTKVRQGMTLIAKGNHKKALEIAERIFGALGKVVFLEEYLFNVGTAISGCGPAFFYEMIEGLILAGVTEGLSRDVALQLVCQTMRGSLDLLEQTAMHPAVLRDEVTSPGGMAAAGLAALTEGGLRTVLHKGISVSAKQADKLSRTLDRAEQQ